LQKQSRATQKYRHRKQCRIWAGAQARRDFAGAIRLLESQKERGGFGLNDLFLLAYVYVYCLNGEGKKAEDLAASNSRLIEEDWFVDWSWGKLQAEFGFHPPN
jgi:hypothetical protein